MERHLNKERPSIGASWLLLAMPVTVLLFWLRIWSDWLRIGIIWFGIGFGAWVWSEVAVVERLISWIRRRGRKENRFKNILYAFTTLGGALVVLLQLYISHRLSMSITWIAACVYFAWSPDLTRTGLLVATEGQWFPLAFNGPGQRMRLSEGRRPTVVSTDFIASHWGTVAAGVRWRSMMVALRQPGIHDRSSDCARD
ncbi:hypothetical protein B0H14DRAFT_3691044 [Mycena olivaceomarginata]|nr:hypothetical protein B0H14DRAFT_3691044 [Mycena olivaceomarginata]